MSYVLFFHGNNVYASVPQRYVYAYIPCRVVRVCYGGHIFSVCNEITFIL